MIGRIATLAILAASVSALPALDKRIAQDTITAAQPWEAACRAAGGGAQCNPIAVTAAGTLLAAPPACAQQDSADAMISLAKTLNNDPEMIRLAKIFRQQPRNSPDKFASLYCQSPPKNPELNGLFQCQFAGVRQDDFTGSLKPGAPGTVPLGGNAVNPPGSCPASPNAPVADGQQLNTLVRDPGSGSGGNGGNPKPAAPSSAAAAPTSAAAAPSKAPAPAPAPAPANGAKPFQLQNGQEAQRLNQSFESLKAGQECTNGDQACIDGGFAQCVGGAFTATQCAAGTQCFALPLVNKPGTSLACTTEADAAARIAATGATGGIRG
ncbi:Proline-rich protein [Ceratobasidium theobromae]|uniref:Proline-rich protein n=1 Tax=Ceratobasidium theobromae TaxID=1582974 RepID=A0A5N5QKV2_9AGAM|nr:Proline-rich protein [Ceratobasidium theobromae]